ncbi:MAG: iron-sulfur cluster assembly accessory protein [Alphaproteobacteria bacterium]|jgi:iron-sulfur cluster assembly accessory protein|nr:iron-sulfur cluster assembly accessory protein [Alphaproteobacteria bacterium]
MTENNFKISLTESAVERLKSVLAKKDAGSFLRIVVSSGGCAGFSTSFKLDTKREEDDVEIVQDGIKVVINKMIAEFIKDAELNYITSNLSSFFRLDVKQATENCSCGSSFNM